MLVLKTSKIKLRMFENHVKGFVLTFTLPAHDVQDNVIMTSF